MLAPVRVRTATRENGSHTGHLDVARTDFFPRASIQKLESYALARAAAILSTLEAIALPPGRTGLLLTRGIGLCGGPGHIVAQFAKGFKATLTKAQLPPLRTRLGFGIWASY